MSSKYYAVANGLEPGIYTDWASAQNNVQNYSGAVFKAFGTRDEAEEFIREYNSTLEKKYDTTLKAKQTDSLIPTLTDEQKYVLDLLIQGKNVLLTGGGGVGKTHLISVIFSELPGLKRIYNGSTAVKRVQRIQLCALTGCAALLLGHKAKTIHSWAGIGLGKGTAGELYVKIRKNPRAMKNWLLTDLLIIDEISMMTGELLDKLNEIAKRIRSNQKPFGGIQVMLVGDFFQLPPVNKGEEAVQFAFESESFREIINHIIELSIIHRQKDEVFQRILKEARHGELSKESCKIIRSYQGREWRENKIRPTLLFPRRNEVDLINMSNLKALTGRRYTYEAKLVYDGKISAGFSEKDEDFQRVLMKCDSDAPYAKEIELTVDAQVMLITNLDPENGLVNGSRGVVIYFCQASGLPYVEFLNGNKRLIGPHNWEIDGYDFIKRSQIPLRLAYACTIHKSQGATLDSALIDIGSGTFEYGQAYVALSRVRSLESLYVYDFDPTAFKAHPRVKEFYTKINTLELPEEYLIDDIINKMNNIDENVKQIQPETLSISRTIQVIKCVDDKTNKIDSENRDTIENTDDTDKMEATDNNDNWLYISIPMGWRTHLSRSKEKLGELSKILSGKEFLPKKEQIWTALELTPVEEVKVVILGQDPYPTPGNAHGLAFSVLSDVRPLPASLKNIYKEMENDIGIKGPKHGYLEAWSKRGVLLLNTVLSVEAGAPQSHSKVGWEEVTDKIIEVVAENCNNVIFVLWGRSAQAKKKLLAGYLDKKGHRVFESAHPSPLSASRGFFGSKPFSTINAWRDEMGLEAVNWQLDEI